MVVPDWSLDVTDTCAPSGLRLVTYKDDRAPVVTVVTVVEGGSASDPLGKEALAHLTEHLWYRAHLSGTATVGATLDSFAISNALTYPDETVYVSEFASEDLPRVLTVEGHRFLSALDGIDEETFAAERQIVLQELRINRIDDATGDSAFLLRQLFPEGHPYAGLGRDSVESISAITLADVQAYAAAHFRPERVTVNIIGASYGDAARQAVFRAFPEGAIGVPEGSLPRNCGAFPPRLAKVPNPTTDARRLVYGSGAVAHPRLVLAWALPSGWDGAEAGVGPFDSLVEDLFTGRGQPVSCGTSTYREAAILQCALALGDRAAANEVAANVLSRLPIAGESRRDSWFGPNWTEMVLRRYGAVLPNAEALISVLGAGSVTPFRFSHATGNPRYYEAVWRELGRAAYESDMQAMSRWITPARAVRGVILPSGGQSPAVTTQFAIHTGTSSGAPPSPELLGARATPIDPERVYTSILPNGLKVAVVPYGSVPIVGVDLVFRGGRTAGDVPGLADVVEANTTWYAYNEQDDVNEDVLRAGVRAYDLSTATFTGYRWTGASGNLPEILWLAHSHLEGEKFERNGARDTAEVLGERLEAWMDDPRGQVSSLAWSRLFDGNPWTGRATWARWRAAQALSDAPLKALFLGVRQPQNALLVIVGDVDAEAAFAAAQTWLGAWPVPKAVVPARAWRPIGPIPEAEEITLVDVPKSTISSLAVACRLDGDPNDPRLPAVEAVARHTASVVLREQSGLAYDPWAAIDTDPVGGNVLQIGASVAPGAIEGARQLIRNILDRLATDDDEELVRRAVVQAANSSLLHRATIAGLLDAVRNALLDEAGLGSLRTRADALVLVKSADIRRIMATCRDRLEYVAAGPASVMSAPLSANGLRIIPINWETFKREQSGRDER